MLNSFFLQVSPETPLLMGQYNPWLVTLSLLVAILASSVGFQVAGVAQRFENRLLRQAATGTGAMALGVGIWSMHFLGMLAFELCTPVRYDSFLTVLSAVPAIAASWLGLLFINQTSHRYAPALLGGSLVGLGIGAMHYSGMAAMVMTPLLRYDPSWFALSVALAIGTSAGGWGLQCLGLKRGLSWKRTLLAGSVFGLGVAATHYAGMAAARFVGTGDEDYVAPDSNLALAVALMVAVVLVLALGANSLLAYMRTVKLLRQALADQQATQHRERRAQSEVLSFINALTEHSIFSETDPYGTIVRVNDAFCRISGYTREELVGQNHRIVNSRTHPPQFWRDMWQNLHIGKPWRKEVCNRAKNGDLYWVDSMIVPMLDEQGNILRVLSIRHDITARKKYERELVVAREAAEQASLSKDAFLATMSHELRTPLNAIIGYAALLQDEQDLTPEQDDASYEIGKAGRHLLDLINDILDLSAITSGQFNVELHPTSVDAVLHDCFSLLKRTARMSGISLTLHTSGGRKTLSNPMRLKQILLNLLSNAIKYNRPQGRVQLEVHATPDARLHFKVIDTGLGIPAEKIQLLFRPFNRLGQEAGQVEGTGIGLSITRQLVERMHGTLGVNSTPGEGSTFWFELPLLDEVDSHYRDVTVLTIQGERMPEAEPSARASAADSPEDAKRILVVEDNPSNRKLIGRQLHGLGYACDFAEDGRQGLRKIKTQAYDAVLSDLQMPVMDGYAMVSAVRALPDERLANLPMIALSANLFEQEPQRWKRAGFDDFLTKPSPPGELQAILALHMGTSARLAAQGEDPRPWSGEADETGRDAGAQAVAFDPGVLPDMVGDDPAVIAEVIADFLEQGAQHCSDLANAGQADDWVQVGFLAHKFASTALFIGAAQLGELCRAIEQACESRDSVTARALLAGLEPVWQDLLTRIPDTHGSGMLAR